MRGTRSSGARRGNQFFGPLPPRPPHPTDKGKHGGASQKGLGAIDLGGANLGRSDMGFV